MNTTARLPHRELAPEALRAMVAVTTAVDKSTLGKPLLDLVYLRVSQVNGCAYCLDLHARDLLADGETFQRINSLLTWREVAFFTARERAALNWAESLTLLTQTQAPDADYEPLAAHFSEREVAELTFAIAQMNAWNRLGVGMKLPVQALPLKAQA